MTETTLEERITRFRRQVAKFKTEHDGLCWATVAAENPLVQAGITAIDGIKLYVDDVTLIDVKGGDADIPIAGSTVLLTAVNPDPDDQ